MKLRRRNNLGVVDGFATTSLEVIVTEGLNVLALLRLLIIQDNDLSSPDIVTKVHSA